MLQYVCARLCVYIEFMNYVYIPAKLYTLCLFMSCTYNIELYRKYCAIFCLQMQFNNILVQTEKEIQLFYNSVL